MESGSSYVKCCLVQKKRDETKPGADLGILVGGGGSDIIHNTYNLSATPFLQISLSAG